MHAANNHMGCNGLKVREEFELSKVCAFHRVHSVLRGASIDTALN